MEITRVIRPFIWIAAIALCLLLLVADTKCEALSEVYHYISEGFR